MDDYICSNCRWFIDVQPLSNMGSCYCYYDLIFSKVNKMDRCPFWTSIPYLGEVASWGYISPLSHEKRCSV